MKINIVGGGVVGLFTAFYLKREGHDVSVFDKTDLTGGCSHGNSGMLAPSHFTPLASPGVAAQGVRWMFDSSSPFFIRPRLDMDLLRWLWRFCRSCNSAQAAAAMPVLRDFLWSGKKLFREFFKETGLDARLEERGILMLYQTRHAEKEEAETARLAGKLGMEALVLSAKEVQDMEPGMAVRCLGGVFFPGDAHLHPNILMSHLKTLLAKQGVEFHLGREVSGFEKSNGKVAALLCGGERFPAGEFVVAGGSWSAKLVKMLGGKLLLQDGKGYSITLKKPAQRPRNAAIFIEARVAVTPMGDDLRFGGTLELSGHDDRVNLRRVHAIIESIPRHYPDLKVEMPAPENVWHGYRPVSPDGLPYVGRLKNWENVTLAAGHAMLGLSLAPATGRLVADLLKNPAAGGDFVRHFNPNRFG